MKRYSILALVLILCLSLLNVTAFAAGESACVTGPGSVRAGDTVTVTLSVTGSGIYGLSGTLAYDSNQLTLVSTETVIGNAWVAEFNGNNFVAYDNNLASPIQGTAAVLSLTFRVGNVTPGTAVKVSFSDLVVSNGEADVKLGTVSYQVQVLEPVSADNTLQTMTVSNATLSPAFDPQVTEYTAWVPFSVSRLDLSVTPANKATVSIKGDYLTPGATTKVTVTVTAENGQSKVYTIKVTREQDPNYVKSSNNELSSIKVQNFLLSPVFNAKVTEYVIWLPYETEKVSVTAKPADSKATVRIEGGEALTAGADNEIKVICVAEDGTEKVYTVIAKRAAAHGATEPSQGTEPSAPSEEPGTTQPSQPADTQPTEGTEPTAPSTAPDETRPGEPSDPTEPAEPSAPQQSDDGGQDRILTTVIACLICLLLGLVAGILMGSKLLRKKAS